MTDDPASTPRASGALPRSLPLIAVACAVIVVVLVSAVLVVGLRGGATRDNEQGLAADVRVFVAAVLSSRSPDRAFDHLAGTCSEGMGFEGFEAAVEAARADLEAQIGTPLGVLAVAEVETRLVEGTGEGAVGETRFTLEEVDRNGLPQGEPFAVAGWSRWTYERGLWRAADCEDPAGLVPLDP